MPVIAQEIIQINANDDLSVVLLDKINSCGCIQSSKLSTDLNIPLERLKYMLSHIADKNEIKCDPKFEICCVDFDSFVDKLNKMKVN